MGKWAKIILISLAAVVVLGILGLVVAKNMLTSKIENFLAHSLPENMDVVYDDIDLNILGGSVQLLKPTVSIKGKTTDSINLRNDMKAIHVYDVGYWDYLFNDKISISSIVIENPKISYYHNQHAKIEDRPARSAKKKAPLVQIDNFVIQDANVSIFEYGTTNEMFKVEKLNLNIDGILFDEASSKQKVPFGFSGYELDFKDLFYKTNAYDNLEIQAFKGSHKEFNMEMLRLYTKYSREKLSTIIKHERDHIDLKVESIKVQNQEFGFGPDEKFFFKSPKVEIIQPVLDIYRDKLVTDDTTIKDLYSNMLRNLKFSLTLNEITVQNGSIIYSEKVKADHAAGTIDFKKLNAKINNVSNTYGDKEKTDLDIHAIFMKTTPIHVLWNFDVNNVNDHFTFQVEVGKLPAQDLNPFLKPNLNVVFEGELLKTYFTIDGNYHDSSVDLRTNYDSFKILILDKEGKKKNKILSAVANLFVKKDSNKSPDDFREGSNEKVERDRTKSVFNFLWLNARSGLLSALTGNGKK